MADSGAIIIKKIKKGGGDGHHGGAWKVAYADFVTAMMAFFLLMWLLGATTEDQRKGIADYFNPTVPIIQVSGGGKDALNGETVFSEKTLARDGAGGSKTPFDQSAEGKDTVGADAQEDLEAQAMARAEEIAVLQEQLIKEALAGEEEGLASHIQTRVTPKGLVIELVETDGEALFEPGSFQASRTMVRLIQVVAGAVSLVTNQVEIVGHTDSTGFAIPRENYTNWELSSDRANSARRLMVASGLAPDQISAVTGKADTEPLTDDPLDPQNRRISITLLKQNSPKR